MSKADSTDPAYPAALVPCLYTPPSTLLSEITIACPSLRFLWARHDTWVRVGRLVRVQHSSSTCQALLHTCASRRVLCYARPAWSWPACVPARGSLMFDRLGILSFEIWLTVYSSQFDSSSSQQSPDGAGSGNTPPSPHTQHTHRKVWARI